MCGIAGIIYRNGASCVGSDMTRMLQSMKHRGPDSTGYALYGPAGTGVLVRYKLADSNSPRDFDYLDRLGRHQAEVQSRMQSLGAKVLSSHAETEYAYRVTLEYTGESTVSPRGVALRAGAPYRVSHNHFEPPISWATKFYKWTDSTSDPRKNPNAMISLAQAPPILTAQLPRLDYEGYRAIPDLPRENFALEASGSVDLAPGEYTLRTICDDGVRVWVDSVLVIDNWAPHESALDFAALTGSHHDIRVQYYQGDGWYELRLDIVRGKDRSPGSPGAHGSD